MAELWVVNATGSQWMFSWRRPFFVWEEAMYADLLEDLAGFVGSQDRDKWRWRLEEDRVFMVKSLYSKLVGRWLGEGFFAESQLRMFTHIWKSPAPAKVVAFSWKLLRDRIPSRINLARRHSLPPDTSLNCALCDRAVESSAHLFLFCEVSLKVWTEVLRWLSFSYQTPPDLFSHWQW